MACSVVLRGTSRALSENRLRLRSPLAMERRPTHAHGTRAARIHGIAEEANAPDAASTSTSTLSTTPAGAPIPNELVEQSEQPKIEVVKTDDAIDGHDKSETGKQTTPPAPPATALVADAKHKISSMGSRPRPRLHLSMAQRRRAWHRRNGSRPSSMQ